MISLAGRYMFVHIPKTGGTSLKHALAGYDIRDRTTADAAQAVCVQGHRTLAELDRHAEAIGVEPLFRFTVVRNPWDRLLSLFSYLTSGGSGSFIDLRRAAEIWPYRGDFRRFVLEGLPRMPLRWHFRPQTYWIGDRAEDIARLDFIARYERLGADYEIIRERVGAAAPLPRLRPSTHPPFADCYDAEMVRIVGAVYARDIELLHYEDAAPQPRDRGLTVRSDDAC